MKRRMEIKFIEDPGFDVAAQKPKPESASALECRRNPVRTVLVILPDGKVIRRPEWRSIKGPSETARKERTRQIAQVLARPLALLQWQ